VPSLDHLLLSWLFHHVPGYGVFALYDTIVIGLTVWTRVIE